LFIVALLASSRLTLTFRWKGFIKGIRTLLSCPKFADRIWEIQISPSIDISK